MLQRDRPAARPRRAADPRSAEPLRSAREILAGSVQRLREATRSDLALALARDAAGAPVVAAAAFEGPPPAAPGESALAAAAALAGATDLRADAARELLALVQPRGSGAAVPVRDSAGELLAVLLVASAPPGSARPRSLALLDAAARRIAAPLAAAAALARLERCDSELRRLDRLASLGTLAAELAHEVRSPLVAVKTVLELLPERRDDPELWDGLLPVARAELERALRLLGRVGEHPRSRAQARGAALAPALDTVGSLLGLLPRARRVRLETSLAEGLPEVSTSPDALRQLLLNLVLNAVEASPEGGRVRIAARRCADGVELRVADEGPGVAAAERARIFEPFHSTRAAGHGGLGLAICRRIALEAGGSIEVLGPETGGAVFRVVLPARG